MKTPNVFPLAGIRVALGLVACLGLTGCFGFLKPAKPTTRHFVLSSLPAMPSATIPPNAPTIGVGQVKMPAYLFNTSLAVRQNANELSYLPTTLWGERLDSGLQRALAANLAVLLPTDQIRLSAWQGSEVSVEVYVAVEQFDVDAHGQAALTAWWRVLAPGGDKTLKAGECRLTKQGPPPESNPSGAVASLSDLFADLSRQIAEAVKKSGALAVARP
jgi:uncharacterized lipoprotein YmbA